VSTTIGLDIGGTKTLAVRMEGHAVVDQAKFAKDDGPADLSKAAIEAARRVWSDDVEAIGIGVAGMVEWPAGVFVWGPHVGGANIPLRADLERAFDVAVVVDNDANVAAFGELRLGAAQGYDDVLVVTLGSGIGGAIVIGGQIYRGTSFAGEVGHMVYDQAGTQCDCGKRGCWETVASGPALTRLARASIAQNPDSSFADRLAGGTVSGEDVTGAADAEDETARSLVAQVGVEFGRGLCSLIALLDPEVVIVGGGLGSVGESLLGPARRVAADALHGGSYRMLPPILVAGLGPSAGAIGAALMAGDLASGRLDRDTLEG
jgi:glucokinase